LTILDPDDDTSSWQMALCFAAAICVAPLVTWHSYFNNASHDRAIELLSHMNLPGNMNAVFRRMIDDSYDDTDNGSGDELEALALSMPTATGELVNGRIVTETNEPRVVNDLELQETATARPIDGFNCEQDVPTAVAVAQPIRQPSMEVVTKNVEDDGTESQFQIV
jgi:hypothetical protein